jgi:proline dehydrogenase
VAQPAAVADRQDESQASVPEQMLRTTLLAMSRRRSLGRLATATPLTRPMVGRFVAGLDLPEALDAVEELNGRGFATTLDVLGESVDDEAAARAAGQRYLAALDGLVTRDLERNVSLKLTQMGLDVGEDVCIDVVGRIIDKAAGLGAFVRVDMEDHARTDATLAIMRRLRARHPDTGIVIQAALRRSAADVEALIAEGTSIRLCKGAYREPSDVAFPDKAEVDRSYVALMERMLASGTRPALATHDPKMINAALRFARREAIDSETFEFQMLYGVRRDLQEQLRDAGYRVRVYVPFGQQWYPYFMRRLAERPANVAFMLRSVVRERETAG